MWGFFPTLGRADVQCLLFTGSITITDEILYQISLSPSKPSTHSNLPHLPAWHRPLVDVGARTSWWDHQLPHSAPAASMGGSSHRGKEAEVPPHATPPLCCGASEHSMHQAESVAALTASHWCLRAKPTCYSAADHGLHPAEVHSFSGPQSPSQGPPNPVRHLLSRWASDVFWQGFASLYLTSGSPSDWV